MKYLIKNKYWEINKDYDKEKLLYLLVDRPTEILYQNLYWYNNKGQYHRKYNLPAASHYNGTIKWFINSNYYRNNNKPDIIWFDGKKEYWSNIIVKHIP